MSEKNTNTPRVVRTTPKSKENKKKKKNVSPEKSKVRKVFGAIGKVFLTTFLVLTITGCIVGTALTIYVMEFIDSKATIDLNRLKLNYTAIVYAKDANGKEVEVQQLNKKENRIWVDLTDIPEDLKKAIILSEDERFEKHYGVDFKRTIYAFGMLIINRDRSAGGASTISQQLVKNITGKMSSGERTIQVKIQEIITALNLERNYSKDRILECYLNYIALDNNINGVQTGAKYYFGKDVSELSLDECTALAVISKSPTTYNPIKNPAKNKERRQRAYNKMLKEGYITQAQYDEVYNKELVLAKENTVLDNPNANKKKYQSWFIDSLINQVVDDLCKEYNYSKENATQLLYTGGYRIHSTMEIETQNILENYFANENNFKPKSYKSNKPLPEAYMTIMDYDGNIVATVGGKGEKKGDRLLNRSFSAQRPAGSTMKPLAVYTPAFEQDIINWSSIYEDSFVQNKENKPDGPINWPNNYNKRFDGLMTIIDALKVSKNTIPVRIVNQLTPQASFDYVYKDLHLESLVPTGGNNNVNAASLALGDGGSTLVELVGAYQIFGNGGYYIEPKMYTKVYNADGKVVLDVTNRKKSQVMSPQTAYIMNKGLWHVVNDGGSGRNARMDKWEVIGKTGTSNDKKDLLFMGATPYYVAGIRYGYDNNDIIVNEGVDTKIVWKAIMEKIHKGKNPAKFELDSEGVVEYDYCTQSGGIAHAGCPNKKKGYYKLDGNMPSLCTMHGYAGGEDQPAQASPDTSESKPNP